jgi:hypothetical protein
MLSGMQITLIAIGLLLNALIVGLGIYLSSYLKKKAQNLATREEFKELEKQLPPSLGQRCKSRQISKLASGIDRNAGS